jgi:hypothetical protein
MTYALEKRAIGKAGKTLTATRVLKAIQSFDYEKEDEDK